jgi:hypothetical protein
VSFRKIKFQRGFGLISVVIAAGILGLMVSFMLRNSALRQNEYRRIASLGDLEDVRTFVRNNVDCKETLRIAGATCNANTTISAYDYCGRELVPATPYTVGNYEIQIHCGPAVGSDSYAVDYREKTTPAGPWKNLFPNVPRRCPKSLMAMTGFPGHGTYWWAQGIEVQNPAGHTAVTAPAPYMAAVADPSRVKNLILSSMGFAATWGYATFKAREVQGTTPVLSNDPPVLVQLNNSPGGFDDCPPNYVMVGFTPGPPANTIPQDNCIGNNLCRGPFHYNLICSKLSADYKATDLSTNSLFWDFSQNVECPANYAMTGFRNTGYLHTNYVHCHKIELDTSAASHPSTCSP